MTAPTSRATAANLPSGPYQVIYADPPWAWGKKPLSDRGRARAVERHYATMQPEEISDLPVNSIAAPDSVLLLWATGPKLPIALDVMSAWGFTYTTIAFAWLKTNPVDRGLQLGMGFYTRSGAELCLLGVRGKGVLRAAADVPQVLVAPVGRHSAKPGEARARVERLFGDVSRVELFARQRARGWDAWGNQVREDEPDLFGGVA